MRRERERRGEIGRASERDLRFRVFNFVFTKVSERLIHRISFNFKSILFLLLQYNSNTQPDFHLVYDDDDDDICV